MTAKLTEVSAAQMVLQVGGKIVSCPDSGWRANPLHRANDAETSRVAAEKACHRIASDRAIIYDVIFQAGDAGATMQDIAHTGRIDYVVASRRGADMERDLLIYRLLKPEPKHSRDFIERDGCAVWFVKK